MSETRDRLLKILLPVGVLALGVAAAGLLVADRPVAERQEIPTLAPLVRTVKAEPREVPMVVRARATVEPRTASTLVAEVAGRIVWVAPSFADGGSFRSGELLVRIDPRDYELAAEQARAQVAQAEVLVTREEAEAEVARREWQELSAQPGAALGEPSPLVAREPQLAEARARLAAARAQLAAAELALSRTRITAPYPGRVQRKRADVGQYVSPLTPLADLWATDYLEVRLPVPLPELAFLDLERIGDGPGAPRVVLSADYAGGRRRWEGRLVRTAGAVDPQTRMLDMIARVEGGAGDVALVVGLFVEAEIEGVTAPAAVELPRAALRGEARVMVVDGEGRLRFREVEVLRRQGDKVYVRAGLEAGEEVCVSPLETPVDGMQVRLEEKAAEAAGEEAGR